ncbi:MAG: IS30 family transposase [Crocinitomix sp.]|nr:IS30 family transposase [Crocinitomix sp.]
MRNKHLTFTQRYSIEVMLKAKVKKKDIWSALKIPESTFYRELKRNSKKRVYNAKYAQILASERKRDQHMKTQLTDAMARIIVSRLVLFWSPEQIVGWCKTNSILMVSHTRIYQYIKEDKAFGGSLYSYLRHQKRYKKKYGSSSSRGQIPDRVPIEQRPNVVEEKSRIGDFEIDLIIGKGHKGAQLTIVDRMTSYTIIQTLTSKRAPEVQKAIVSALMPYKSIVKTITNDNGKEFSLHKLTAKQLNTDVFFCNPYASYERGLNEYINKLIRQFYPKQMELDCIKQSQNIQIMDLLNKRPRKKLKYQTPEKVFFTMFELENEKLALAS